MSLLSKLNKPITLSDSSKKYSNNLRPLKEYEIELLKKEINLLKKNTRIVWGSFNTYVPSLMCTVIVYLIFKQILIAIISFPISFLITKVIPFFLKGDSGLLKKDIKGGVVCVKTGSVAITEENFDNTYMKRVYLDDVIVDGVYYKGGVLKYSNLIDGQNIEVIYSPNAQYIFSVRSL